jgi:fucose permease
MQLLTGSVNRGSSGGRLTLSKTDAAHQHFVRDRLAWFCYFLNAVSSFTASALGPLMIFLRSEMQLNYTTVAYHFSAWSLGILLTGFSGDQIMKRFGKRRTVWLSCTGCCLGLAVIMSAHQAVLTIAAALLAGFCAGTLNQCILTILADRFAELRATAITEANVAASLFSSFAPLAVGMLSQTALGWRTAVVLPMVCFCCSFLFARESLAQVSEPARDNTLAGSNRLPGAYWLCWLVIFLSVASEWSIVFWAADFMEKTAQLSKPDAAFSVTPFLAAMVAGRFVGSRLTRTFNSLTLLRLASLAALPGFLTFWLNKSAWLCVCGLFTMGLGISLFYPLTFALAIGTAPELASKATSRMSLSSGGATLLAPLLLGIVAEQRGIFTAYGLVAALLAACAILIFLPVWRDSQSTT